MIYCLKAAGLCRQVQLHFLWGSNLLGICGPSRQCNCSLMTRMWSLDGSVLSRQLSLYICSCTLIYLTRSLILFIFYIMPSTDPAIFCLSSMLASDSLEDEDGDFRGKEDRDHRHVSEQDKNRVTWNIERRCYLDPGANKRCGPCYC